MSRIAAMSGQSIGITNRLRSSLAILAAYRAGKFGDPREDIRYHQRLVEIFEQNCPTALTDASLLEIGCGQLAKQVALFSTRAATVTGIDMEIPTFRMNPKTFVDVVRHNGLERAIKSAVRHQLFDRATMRGLERACSSPIRWNALDVRRMDAAALEFKDDCMDFVFSKATFEHIADVRGAVREVSRVLRDGGVAYISIHLFPSLSGGHNLAWLEPDQRPSTAVPAWDHLRENRYPVNTFLNRMRIDEYRKIFQEELEVLQEQVKTEGEGLLTEELERKLAGAGYGREDLLARNLTILARPRAQTA